MKIVRAEDVERFMKERIQANWGKEPREGIHLSDLLALRQAFWKRVHPMHATMDEIMYWAAGKGHEGAFSRAAEMEHAEAKQWEGIWYTPDFYHSFPAELKTRRRGLAKPGEEAEKYDHYLNQLRGYCACEDKQQGWLHVMSLLEKQGDGSTKPELACYRVEFTKEELEKERFSLKRKRDDLLFALDTPEGHKALEQCPQWMCGRVSRAMVSMPHCVECNKDFSTEYGGANHAKTKAGAGHTVTAPKFEYSYEKKCKWFDLCQPTIQWREVNVDDTPSQQGA